MATTKPTTYKLRADCAADFAALASLVAESPHGFAAISALRAGAFPVCVIEITTTATLAELRALLATIDDGHVMLETVQPIERYTGERAKSLDES